MRDTIKGSCRPGRVALLGLLVVCVGATEFKVLGALRLQAATYDAAFYLDVAGNVCAGRGLTSDIVIDPSHGRRPPCPLTLVYYLYPLLVGEVARTGISCYGAAKVVSVVGSTLWLGLFGVLLWRAREPASILEGLAFAACFAVVGLHPGLCTYGFLAYSENVYFPLLALVAIAYGSWGRSLRAGPWAALGALAAVSMQARIDGLLLAGALAIVSLLVHESPVTGAELSRASSSGRGAALPSTPPIATQADPSRVNPSPTNEAAGAAGAAALCGRRRLLARLRHRSLPLALGFAAGAMPLLLLHGRAFGDPLHGLRADLERTAAGTRQASLEGSLAGRLASALVEGLGHALDPRDEHSLHRSVGPFLVIGLLGFLVVWSPWRAGERDHVALLLTVYSALIMGALTFRQEAEPFRWQYDHRYAFVLVPVLSYHVWLSWPLIGSVARTLFLLGALSVGVFDAREARGFFLGSNNVWFRDPPAAFALSPQVARLGPEATLLASDAGYLNFKTGARTVLLYPYPLFPSVSWLVDRYGITHVALHKGEEVFVQADPIRKRWTPVARVSAGEDEIALYRIAP